jgi:hypothetical protein
MTLTLFLRSALCKLVGHKQVRIITGFQLDAAALTGAVAGRVTAEHFRCSRCGLIEERLS